VSQAKTLMNGEGSGAVGAIREISVSVGMLRSLLLSGLFQQILRVWRRHDSRATTG
jgi:hypothetical protein